MAHCNTILSLLLKLVPRHEFETLVKNHHSGRTFRTASRWSQFVTMAIGQLSARRSLRDLVDSVSAQQQRLHHLGSAKLSRPNLSRINGGKPYELYETLFGAILKRCQSTAPGHGFRFKNELYSMDVTTIDLCLSLFPWATFRKAKGGIMLHVAMNHKGNLPEFVSVTEAREHVVKQGRSVEFPKGSIVAVVRGYTDYEWYKSLSDKSIYFVARLRGVCFAKCVNAHDGYRLVIARRSVDKSTGVRVQVSLSRQVCKRS